MATDGDGILGLIDQNTTAAELLSGNAEMSAKSADLINTFASGADEALTESCVAAHAALANMQAELETATQQVEAAGLQAIERINALTQRLQESEAQVTQFGTEVAAQLEMINQRAQEISSFIEGTLPQITDQLEDLQAQSDQIVTEVTTHVASAMTELDALQQSVNQGQESLGNLQTEVVEQFGSFEDSVEQDLEELTSSLEQMWTQGEESIKTLEDELNEASAEAMSTVEGLLKDELSRNLDEAKSSVTESLDFLTDAVSKGVELMGSKAGEVMDAMEDITGVIETIEPVLEMVDTLL